MGWRTTRYGPRTTRPRASGRTPKQRPSASTEANSQAHEARATRTPARTRGEEVAELGGWKASTAAIATAQATIAAGSRDLRRGSARPIVKTAKRKTTAVRSR